MGGGLSLEVCGASSTPQRASWVLCLQQQLGAVNCVLPNPEYFSRKNTQFFPKCHENFNDGNK